MADLLDVEQPHHRLRRRRGSPQPDHPGALGGRRRHRRRRVVLPLDRRAHRRRARRLRRQRRRPPAAPSSRRIRGWSADPFSHVVYTHGHVDHVGGSGAFAADAAARGDERPIFLGHENVPRPPRPLRADQRLEPADQPPPVRLAAARPRHGHRRRSGRFLPADVVAPDVTYRDELTVDAAGTAIRLIHARGETDDHTWAWLPEQRGRVRRRPVHLELPERRQPAEGAALPGGLGGARCARSSSTSPSCCCPPTACRSPGASASPASSTSPPPRWRRSSATCWR